MSAEETNVAGLVTLASWRRSIGISGVTAWRWVKAGWLHPVNIGGGLYLRVEDCEEFRRRAEAGEFAKPPHGAAAKEESKP